MSSNPFSSIQNAFLDDLSQLNPHVPTSARVYNEIRTKIISFALPPETTLARADLAKHFNVSQSPVREAILRLEQDGLVMSYPQSRTVVTKIDTFRVREEHFLRSSVECEVVRKLAITADQPTILKIKGILKMQEALVDDIDQIELFKQLDETFHRELFNGVNQANLHQFITSRCSQLARLRTLDLPREGKMLSVLKGHQAVVASVETGDGDKAMKTMREHLSGSIERLPQIVSENSQYFSDAPDSI